MKTNVGKILLMPKGAWASDVTYRYLDMVSYNGAKWVCKAESVVGVEPSTMTTDTWYLWDDSDVGGAPVEFTMASSRLDLQSGETLSTLIGKIKKYLADLKAVAFSGSFADLTNVPNASTTTKGVVKVDGTSITVDADGTIHGASSYELPIASTVALGGVKIDGETITIDEDGTIRGNADGDYVTAADVIEPVESPTPRDADTLGGLYTAEDITEINNKLAYSKETLLSGVTLERDGRKRELTLEGAKASEILAMVIEAKDVPTIQYVRGFCEVFATGDNKHYLGELRMDSNGNVHTFAMQTIGASFLVVSSATSLVYGRMSWIAN